MSSAKRKSHPRLPYDASRNPTREGGRVPRVPPLNKHIPLFFAFKLRCGPHRWSERKNSAEAALRSSQTISYVNFNFLRRVDAEQIKRWAQWDLEPKISFVRDPGVNCRT